MMRSFTLLVLATATAIAQESAPLEVRFCGQQPLYQYPLSNEMQLQGVLLPYVSVINRGSEPLELASLDITLQHDGAALDSRHFTPAQLDAFGQVSAQFQAIPAARDALALFCEQQLVPKEIALGGPKLAPRQALLILNQAFAFDGQRDSLSVHATATSGGKAVQASASLPVTPKLITAQYRLPVKGAWLIKSGPSFHTHHRWARPSEFALDFVKVGPDGRSHKGDGSRFTDYYAYDQDVLAAANGRVVRAVNNQPEPTALLARSGEAFEAYAKRTASHAQSLVAGGIDAISGNHVMIDHGDGEYALYAHLRPGSVRVKVGQEVKAGEAIAKLGGSGNALVEPHLHFHVCDRPSPLTCAGIPVEFVDIEKPFVSFAPRAVQSGDIVIAN
jgi:murein DD-endopeptidase MepM/ murein hydrolase activator NlpD